MIVKALFGAIAITIALLIWLGGDDAASEWVVVENADESFSAGAGEHRYLMGRKVGGIWQYREMTPQEREDLPDQYF